MDARFRCNRLYITTRKNLYGIALRPSSRFDTVSGTRKWVLKIY
jgi:hypothetical protein